MTALTALWLPILLSAIFVFAVSAVIHMAPLWHKNDYKAVPQQDQTMATLRPLALPPGTYMMPHAANTEEMRSPAFAEKFKQGPVAIITVLPNRTMSMSRNLIQWFIYTWIVSYFAAYVTSRALPPGAEDTEAFRFAGTTAFLAYGVGIWQMSIWFGRPWSTAMKDTFDALIYAVVTGMAFCWLWPR